ncbi:Crp/Fnr family transcriptional regulator [Epilithonimonas mollis]|uniref:cAMP-binding domain of CRP or a regulatory subunit of cAMP-dependent protein kinases n=1 Tax=Epilithonimonas mollis TaxID=216903 RepID=A0A1M6NMM4_9FLAO|nr:Crp/Fnr family transcriptional regulator [Epilithonimonas mollis]SHJ96812.1 cAMP-binding domain of CRP or a regulatory subunit of cAMP-dependent protein kinases [Epilithonimonas mollis]
MVIEETIIKLSGAKVKEYSVGDIIFSEGSSPLYYYQIVEGEVKLNNYNEDGREMIQSILTNGHSIGEFLLFMNKLYPMNAVAITPCTILRLSKNKFFSLLENYPETRINIIQSFSDSMYFKFVMGQIFSTKNPATKLRALMDYLKSLQADQEPFSFQIPLTRQQMASITGLRVETTIRTLKNLERENIVKIHNRKILY